MTGKKESAQPGAPQTKNGGTVSGNGKTVNIAVYHHEKFGDLRVTDREGKPWFVALDMARSLGYADPDQAVRNHCKQVRKSPVQDKRQVRHLKMINESDMFRLAMQSRMPRAVEYQDWVVEEVLPSIHRTGVYVAPELRSVDWKLLRAVLRSDRQLARQAERREARLGVKAFLSLLRRWVSKLGLLSPRVKGREVAK